VAQPGVLLAKALNSATDITTPADTGTGFGVDIRTPAPGYVTYDPAMNALRISVPASMGAPANSWAYSLPYEQQFDSGSEFWVQFDVRWDAGMLTPSNGGGGIKFFTVDEGDVPSYGKAGSCDNYSSGGFPSGEFQVVGHVFGPQPNDLFPTLYHSCGYIKYPGDTNGHYDGLYTYLSNGDVWLQNQITGCTYRNQAIPPCVGLTADVWYTFTLHVTVGTWYKNDGVFHADSQVDLWASRGGLPATYLISKQHYDLVNASPGTARYGKLWLLPFDTGRTSSSVDGNVWYRDVLWSGQPLADPATGVPLIPSSPARTALAAIGNNGWLGVTPNPSTRYIPTGNPSTLVTVPSTPSNQSTPGGRSYSGITYGGGVLLYWGGAHNSWPGNDMETYFVDNNVWVQSWIPEVCPNITASCGAVYGGSASPVLTPLGRAYGEHAYQQMLWRPDLGKFELLSRATGMWTLDPFLKTMTHNPVVANAQGVTVPSGTDVAKAVAFWSPAIHDRLVIITSGTNNGVWKEDPATHQWARVGSLPAATLGGTFYQSYVASQRKHFLVNIAGQGPSGTMSAAPGMPRTWWWLDPTTLTFTQVAMPSGPDVADAFDYDAKNDRIVAIQDSADPIKVWVGTADATSWSSLPLTAAPPSNAYAKVYDVRAVAPSWQYDPVNNVFWYLHVYYLSDFGVGPVTLWAYRYGN
jgi:hypothetical protein